MDWNTLILPAIEQMTGVKNFIIGLMCFSAIGIVWRLIPKEQRKLIKAIFRIPF